MSTILFADFATTTLAGAITSSSTTAALAPGTGVEFPSPGAGQYFVGILNDAATGLRYEVVWVTNISTDTITMVRAQEGTAAQNWLAGDIFFNGWTSGQAAGMLQQGQQTNFYQATAGAWSASIPLGCSVAKVQMGAGAGGGAGGGASQAGGGGGQGGMAIAFLTGLVSGQVLSGIIGAGGLAGTASNNGGLGANTTLNVNGVLFLTCGGANFGQATGPGGQGGGVVASGGFTNYIPLLGSWGSSAILGGITVGGDGAPGWMGAGSGRAGAGAGIAGSAPCAGGGGGSNGSGPGGAGAPGFVLVEWCVG